MRKHAAPPALFDEASLKEFKALARTAAGIRDRPKSPSRSPSRSPSPPRSPPLSRQSSVSHDASTLPPETILEGGQGKANREARTREGKADLRQKLRPVFDKFDVDHSGSVSTSEMGKMLSQIGMHKSPEELKQLMVEADPDGSGEIDFNEFVAVLSKQMKDGGGGLFSVFTGASSLFGFLNPLSWFGGQDSPRLPAGPRSPVRAYGGGSWCMKQSSLVALGGQRSLDSSVEV